MSSNNRETPQPSYILSLETSCNAGGGISLAKSLPTKIEILKTVTNQKNQKYGQFLGPALEQLFNEFSLTPGDFKGFILSVGPGSFTGIRIGLATLQGYCFQKDIPIWGISSLHAMTQSWLRDPTQNFEAGDRIWILRNAFKGDLFLGCYEVYKPSHQEGAHFARPTSFPDQVIQTESCLERIKAEQGDEKPIRILVDVGFREKLPDSIQSQTIHEVSPTSLALLDLWESAKHHKNQFEFLPPTPRYFRNNQEEFPIRKA